MENSAYEALITGVNVTIFIVATTIGIMLFTTVLDLSDLANKDVIKATTGSIMIDGQQVEKRIVTGTELLAYYTNYEKNKAAMQNAKDILKVIDGTTQNLSEYIENGKITQSLANKNFELYLESVDAITNQETYVFKFLSNGVTPTGGFITT